MRLFFAIRFNEAVNSYLHRLTRELTRESGMRGVSRDNLHLTLKFLGEYPPETLPLLQQAMQAVSLPTFTLTTAEPGFFRQRHGNILFMKVLPCKELELLHTQLCTALKEVQIEPNDEAFSPHITLARTRGSADPQAVLQEITPLLKPHACNITEFVLMHSHRVNDVLTYTPLFSRRLITP